MKIRLNVRRVRATTLALVFSASTILSVLVPGLAHAAGPFTCTWTGGGGMDHDFSNASNWSGCNSDAPQPADNDALVFDDTTVSIVVPHNDLVGASFSSITFQGDGTHGSFILDGTDFTLAGNITVAGGGDFSEVDNNVTVSSNRTITVPGGAFFTFGGTLSGSGGLIKAGLGEMDLVADNTGYTGAITVNAGRLVAGDPNALATSGGTTINAGTDISFVSCSDATFAGNITLTGASSDTTGDLPLAKLNTGGLCSGGPSDEQYGQRVAAETITLTGNITLGSDITFGALPANTDLTGGISGAHNINLVPGYGGKLNVQASSNTSLTANGTYSPAQFTKTLSDSIPGNTVAIEGNSVLTIDGSRSDTQVFSGATLKGTGTVGALTTYTGSTVAPGHSPGCLSSGDLILAGTYQAEIGGTTACTGYDQLKVTGTVTLTGSTLTTSLYNSYAPKAGESYTIIDNDGADAVTGTFTGLAEGATFTVGGTVFKISYVGGTGNDVVLSIVSAPATPDTGFGLLSANPLLTLLGTTVAAAGIFGAAKRTQKIQSQNRR